MFTQPVLYLLHTTRYVYPTPFCGKPAATLCLLHPRTLFTPLGVFNPLSPPMQAQNIINMHVDRRREERNEDPRRFDIRPTLGELARRTMPPITPAELMRNTAQDKTDNNGCYLNQ